MRNRTILLASLVSSVIASAQEDSLSFDDLFSREVESASGLSESYLTAPASMNVITKEDIIDRGYTSIDELLMDVSGFDISLTNGITYMNAYQRGYRTPFTKRTLILINGKVDNHLWTHMANFSRQYPISNIEKVEILYGPSSAVYGANAFLGVVNIITKDAASAEEDFNSFESTISTGSFNTRNIDLYTGGKSGDISYSIGAKVFHSDEQDLSDKFGFISNDIYSNERRWVLY